MQTRHTCLELVRNCKTQENPEISVLSLEAVWVCWRGYESLSWQTARYRADCTGRGHLLTFLPGSLQGTAEPGTRACCCLNKTKQKKHKKKKPQKNPHHKTVRAPITKLKQRALFQLDVFRKEQRMILNFRFKNQ